MQRGHAQEDITKKNAARLHTEECLAPAGLSIKPYVGIVALLDSRRRKPRLVREQRLSAPRLPVILRCEHDIILAHPLRVRQAVSLICHDGRLFGRYDLNNRILSD